MWSMLGKACVLLSHGCDPAALALHQGRGWVNREVGHVAHRHGADSFACPFSDGDFCAVVLRVAVISPKAGDAAISNASFKFNSTFDFLGLADVVPEQAWGIFTAITSFTCRWQMPGPFRHVALDRLAHRRRETALA